MRTRQDPAGEGAAAHGGNVMPYAYAGLDDAAAWHDEQLGKIFRHMRLSLKVSRETVARRLATTTACIDGLETGSIGTLPHAKETERIVRGYCELLQMDPEPILWRLRGHLQALASQAAPVAQGPRTSPPTTTGRPVSRSQRVTRTERTATARSSGKPRRRRRVRALFALSAPVALFAGVVYLAHVEPRPVYRALALLPQSVASAARAGLDYVVLLTAPRREGLRWIEVSDPRMRKADKLQTIAR